jgi:hypothetical protein
MRPPHPGHDQRMPPPSKPLSIVYNMPLRKILITMITGVYTFQYCTKKSSDLITSTNPIEQGPSLPDIPYNYSIVNYSAHVAQY